MEIDIQNLEIHQELSWIFINLMSCNADFIIAENFLNNYLIDYINKLIDTNNTILQDNVLHLVANLMGDSKTILFVFQTKTWEFVNA